MCFSVEGRGSKSRYRLIQIMHFKYQFFFVISTLRVSQIYSEMVEISVGLNCDLDSCSVLAETGAASEWEQCTRLLKDFL